MKKKLTAIYKPLSDLMEKKHSKKLTRRQMDAIIIAAQKVRWARDEYIMNVLKEQP